MKCIIVDDEPLARKGIENLIKDVPFMEVVATCNDAVEAIDILTKTTVDLIFLDIHMPKISGINFLKNNLNLPPVIITTAYPNYAVESYEYTVIDYLIKPISFERFLKAVTKAKDYLAVTNTADKNNQATNDYCFIKCEKSYEKLFFNEILYVEAMLNYVILHTSSKKYISYLTLKAVEEQLPETEFLKVNKSFIVNINKIERVEGNMLSVGGVQLQLGPSFKDLVMEKIVNNKLLKR